MATRILDRGYYFLSTIQLYTQNNTLLAKKLAELASIDEEINTLQLKISQLPGDVYQLKTKNGAIFGRQKYSVELEEATTTLNNLKVQRQVKLVEINITKSTTEFYYQMLSFYEIPYYGNTGWEDIDYQRSLGL